MERRHFLQLGAAAVATLAANPQTCRAQAYPSRPVRIIVGFPAGGISDITARLIGQSLSAQLGQPFIIENRPGATTNLATEAVVNVPGDGYTLLLATMINAVNATAFSKLNFNFIRDIAPVASIIDAPLIMEVNPSIPATTLPEFIAYAKANPGKINYASVGTGSPNNVAGELFKMMADVDITHVPYRGSSAVLADLISGQVQVGFDPLVPSIDLIKAGKLRALATTSTARLNVLPDIPTVSEFFPSFEVSAWQGLGAPKSTPTAVIDTINRHVQVGLADSELTAKLVELGAVLLPGSPADFADRIARDTEKWAKVVKFAGIKAD